MIINQLFIKDYKRIEAFELDPKTGEPIILTGNNGQGKSSILDAILDALQTNSSGSTNPVRHGKEKAKIELNLSNGSSKSYLISRTITDSGNYLKVEDETGNAVPKAQTFINELIGNLAFDPEAFMRLKPKQQLDEIRQITGLDFSELEAKRKSAFELRTEVNRNATKAENYWKSIIIPEKVAKVSIASLLEERNQISTKLSTANFKRDEMLRIKTGIDDHLKYIEELEEKLTRAKSHVAELKSELEIAEANLSEVNVDALTQELAQIDQKAAASANINEQAAKYENAVAEKDKARSEFRRLSERAEELSEQIKRIDAEKSDKMANANLPVEGLELGEDGILVNGTPFSDLNTAEKIKISTAIAMAQNPELRIIIIREGALINRANLSLIIEMAKSKGYQIWIEKFQEEPGEQGLHICEGKVVAVNGEKVKEDNTPSLFD